MCRGNYIEALICVVAMLPFGDMLKSLKYADEAKGILKYGDEFLKGVKTVAKEGSEKLSKQMSKVIKSGKLDNVIASMDAGKHYIVKMRDGTVTAIEKTGLPEKIRVCLGNGCFIAGTLVTTRSGLKPIEEIKIGDYVLSRNEETGEDSYKKVTDTLVRSTQEICTIELENGKINSTTGHLFMVKNKCPVVELVAGDILVTSYGEDQIVKSIKVEAKGYQVITYNLTVEDNHTFFVNYEGVLTHNMNNVLKGCNFAKEGIEEVSESVINGFNKAETKYVYNMVENPGPLAEIRGNPASNFLGGKYNVKVLDEDIILYRSGKKGGLTIPGQEQNALGQWFTREPAESVVKVRVDSAVKAQWINPKTGALTGTSPLEATYSIKIPKGTTIYEGPVGYQGGCYLGGESCNQIFISEPWKIKGVQPISEIPIH